MCVCVHAAETASVCGSFCSGFIRFNKRRSTLQADRRRTEAVSHFTFQYIHRAIMSEDNKYNGLSLR